MVENIKLSFFWHLAHIKKKFSITGSLTIWGPLFGYRDLTNYVQTGKMHLNLHFASGNRTSNLWKRNFVERVLYQLACGL